MTKLGLRWRIKLALWSFYSDELWATWRIFPAPDKDFMSSYNETIEGLVSRLTPDDKEIVKQIAELKAMYRMREGSKVLNGTNTKLIDNVRQFEDLHWKQLIERVQRKEAYEKKESDKKKQKELAYKTI